MLRSQVLNKVIQFNSFIINRNMSLLRNQAYVDGEWINAASCKTFEVFNPFNGAVVGTAPDMTIEDAEVAIDKAYEAFPLWSDLSAKERGSKLRAWNQLMEKNLEEIAQIMTSESGKPIKEARGEVVYGNSFVDWFSEEARRIQGEIIQSPAKSKQVLLYKQPIGVAGLITPWNFPHAMITRKAGAALAAGCTVVVRPAEDTPLTALAIAALAHEAGIPKGVFNVITSSREHAGSIGKLFCESPCIAGISFTGSTAVGKLLYKQCASGIKRLGLELGGNAPFIVFENCNIDKAVEGALASKFRNCGQTCVSANRFLISTKVYDEFICKFKAAIEKIKLGNPKDDNVTAGPLINKAQFDKVSHFVCDAIEKGCTVVTGGSPATDTGKLFYQPTLLTDIKENMLCYSQEVFGPIAACIPFETEEEAIDIANSVPSGLAGYFYSNDVSQIFRVARKLEVGMVGANEGMISMAEAAFGGVKESGIGREGSHHGIDDYVYIKYLCLGNMQ